MAHWANHLCFRFHWAGIAPVESKNRLASVNPHVSLLPQPGRKPFYSFMGSWIPCAKNFQRNDKELNTSKISKSLEKNIPLQAWSALPDHLWSRRSCGCFWRCWVGVRWWPQSCNLHKRPQRRKSSPKRNKRFRKQQERRTPTFKTLDHPAFLDHSINSPLNLLQAQCQQAKLIKDSKTAYFLPYHAIIGTQIGIALLLWWEAYLQSQSA